MRGAPGPPTALLQEIGALFRCGDAAGGALAEPAGAVTRDDIIEGVAEEGWDDGKDGEERPGRWECAGHAQQGGGTGVDAGVVDDHDGQAGGVGHADRGEEFLAGSRLLRGEADEMA